MSHSLSLRSADDVTIGCLWCRNDNCDAISWKVISKTLDIDFVHGDIHGRPCKKYDIWEVYGQNWWISEEETSMTETWIKLPPCCRRHFQIEITYSFSYLFSNFNYVYPYPPHNGCEIIALISNDINFDSQPYIPLTNNTVKWTQMAAIF